MNRVKKGRFAEYFVMLKLMEKGADIYPSISDDRGVDFIVRNPCGQYVEIQVKSSWAETNKDWFQFQTKTREIPIRQNYFIVGVEKNRTCWAFPSAVFFDERYSGKANNASGGFTFDLKLSTTRRGNQRSNRELLKKYKNGWEFIINYPNIQ